MTNIRAVIAAGGYARRLETSEPKALIRILNRTYLDFAVDNALWAGARTVDIYCNRPEYAHVIRARFRTNPRINVIIDHGPHTTFELLRESADRASEERLLFMYGHNPQSTRHVLEISHSKGIVAATSVSKTTKKNRIPTLSGRYLEPPYSFATSFVRQIQYSDWVHLFRTYHYYIFEYPTDWPGEFNYKSERKVYDKTFLLSVLSKSCPHYASSI